MATPLALAGIRSQITAALRPAHFFVSGPLRLQWEHVATEEVSWEIFQGRLLDASQTRQRQEFEAWNIYAWENEIRSAEPLLAVKLDPGGRQLHIVRAIYSYAWEGYHAGDNVYLSREMKKWLRELVATVALDELTDADALAAILAHRLTQAVVGTSRLPLTSIEAPLPAFALGQLGYFPLPIFQWNAWPAEIISSGSDLLGRGLQAEHPWPLKARLLEMLLRSTPTADLGQAAAAFAARWTAIGHTADAIAALLRTMFDDIALSPYTDFVDKTLVFLDELEKRGHWTTVSHIDFLSALLRQLVRHLTAFDLVTFHHRGANYPDALLLDAALHSYLRLAEGQPERFAPAAADDEAMLRQKRRRRRAMRQACLLRCWYEEHPVPDLPTSPGENSRVLPPEFPRVPAEQITDPTQRQRRLFAGEPLLPKLDANLLHHCLQDLDHPAELQELGLALYLDRPLGIGKWPGEPDQTPLLSYEAFSATIAARRLTFLKERFAAFAAPETWARWAKRLESLVVPGLPLERSRGPTRPGVASLADAFGVADDFIVLRTTRRSARALFMCYNWETLRQCFRLEELEPEQRVLIVGGAAIGKAPLSLWMYDAALRLRLEMKIHPQGSLRVRQLWETTAEPGELRCHDLSSEEVLLPLREWP